MKDMWLVELDRESTEVIDLSNFDEWNYDRAIARLMETCDRMPGQISERIDTLPSPFLNAQVLILKDEYHEKVDGDYCFTAVKDKSVYVIYRGNETDVTLWKLSEPLVKNATYIRNMSEIWGLME